MHMVINVTGKAFKPSMLIKQLDTELAVDASGTFDQGELSQQSHPQNQPWPYGCLDIQHPLKYSHDNSMPEYEESFVQLFEKNDTLLKQHGATDYQIFMYFYYCLQGNFEIFDKDKLARLAKYCVSLPLTVIEQSKEDYANDIRKIHHSYGFSDEPESLAYLA